MEDKKTIVIVDGYFFICGLKQHKREICTIDNILNFTKFIERVTNTKQIKNCEWITAYDELPP